MQQTTGQLKLNKIDLTDVPDITVLNPNFDKLDTEVTKIKNDKVDKVSGKSLSTNDYTNEEKTKLANVASNANNYTHPTSHPPSIMTQDANNRLVTDSEKSTWNSKAPTTPVTTNTNGLMSKEDKSKLDGVTTGANRIILNNTITSTSTSEGATANVVKVVNDTLLTHSSNTTSHVTANERTIWSGKASTSVATTTSNGLMAKEDKIKLNGVATGANNYVHPAAHPASIITQDSTHRFVTDAEKSTWNRKTDKSYVDTQDNNLSKQITVLSEDRGYLSSVMCNDANLISKNGKYVFTNATINKPFDSSDWFVCDGTFEQNGSTTGRLLATCYTGNNTGKMFVKTNLHGEWSPWKQIATTDEIGIGFGGSCKYVEGNVNDIINNGRYFGALIGAPIEYTCFYDVFRGDNINYITQECLSWTQNRRFFRTKLNGVWSSWSEVATTEKIDISLFNGWVEQYDSWNSTSLQIIGGEVRGSIWIKNASITQAWATILSIQGATFLTKSRPVLLFSTTTQLQYIGQFNNSALACPSNMPVGDYIITF